VGGPGNDTMIAGLGHTNFIVGTGNNAITLGGVADVITFQNGSAGGLTTISGFRPGTDGLRLAGYGAGASAAAVQGQTSDGGGGSLLSLGDGTRIDLAGIPQVTQSAFV
jgi:hypothetical protein